MFEDRGSYALWRARHDDVELRFVGRGPRAEREQTLRAIGVADTPVAWAKQVHGAAVLAARAGECGRGDALATEQRALALAVATADCVPVLLASRRAVAAVHAGWRGLVAGVLPAASAALADSGALRAWIGPAIGACCYEVGDDVAREVVGASHADVAQLGPRGKPHLDLAAAARWQLEASGIRDVELLVSCTYCDPRWWSYRRDGAAAGRNLAFIWRA